MLLLIHKMNNFILCDRMYSYRRSLPAERMIHTNHLEMQKANRCAILRLLLEEKGLTRTNLARRASLQKATITNIVSEFAALGILSSPEGDCPTIRGQLLSIRAEHVYILTVSINRKDYRIRLYALHGQVMKALRKPFDGRARIEEITAQIKADAVSMADFAGRSRIICTVLAMPGPYVRKSITTVHVSRFEQLSRVDLQKELESALEIPVISEHDAKLSAYAEWKNAAEVRNNPDASLIYLGSVGYGVGAGLIMHGNLLTGQLGVAGEVGHMGISFHGPANESGHRGTFESYAGTDSAIRYMREEMYRFPNTCLNEDCTYPEIAAAYQKRDPLAVSVMEKMAWMLGYGIANLVFVLNPDCIVLGAEYPNDPEFMEHVRSAVSEMVYPDIMESLSIRYSSLDDDTVLRGAYYYALETMTRDNSLFDRIRLAVESAT